MYFLIFGEDSFRSRQHVNAVREQFMSKRDEQGMNTRTLRADNDDIGEVLQEIYASPFLGDRKMLVLEGYLRADREQQLDIFGALSAKPESTIVVFYESCGRADLEKSPLFASLAEQKFSTEFPPLTPAQASQMIASELAAAAVSITPLASRQLATLAGSDSNRLANEIAKLVAYARGAGVKAIDLAHIALMVADEREGTFFNYIDLCVAGKSADALALVSELLGSGMAGPQISAMLLKQLRSLISVRDLMDRGDGDNRNIAARLSIHPFAVTKAKEALSKLPMPKIRALYTEALQMDRGFKSGGTPPAAALALFTMHFAA